MMFVQDPIHYIYASENNFWFPMTITISCAVFSCVEVELL